jgi:DNA polymerase-3 subunit delta
MIIFLYGQDSYRISQKLKEIVSGYKVKNPSGLNLVFLDLNENSFKDLEQNLLNSSLMPEKKLIIVKNIFNADSETILNSFKSQNLSKREDIVLVTISFKDSKNGLFDYLTKKPNQSQKFEALKEYEIKNWVRRFLNSSDIDLTGEALDFLVSNCNSDLWRLDCEIRKLADFKVKGVISRSQVEELMIPGRDHNIFELTDALARKNKKRALIALSKAVENGEKPTELLGLLAWQIRNLLRFKTSANPSELKLHPFVLEKLKESAKLFSIGELNAILSKIINLDLAFKTSDVDEKTALSLLISEI